MTEPPKTHPARAQQAPDVLTARESPGGMTELPAFAAARSDVAWRFDGRTLAGTCDGVDVVAERRWWGRRWSIHTAAPFPVPEKVLLFVSRDGMDHAYWRDLPVGDRGFDDAYFVFSDAPALLPLIVGAATRHALIEGDRERRRGVVIDVFDGVARTTCVDDGADPGALARHLAVHRALAGDHAEVLARWDRVADVMGGRAIGGWPPGVMLLRPLGSIAMDLHWENPDDRDAATWDRARRSLRTELSTGVPTKRRGWWLQEVSQAHPRAQRFGSRWFQIEGELPTSRRLLGELADRAGLRWMTCSDFLTIAIPGMVTRAPVLEAAIQIVELICAPEGSQSPYR